MRKSYIAVLAFSVAGVVAGFQGQNIVDAVGGRYEAGNLSVQALGACSYTVDSISCWDLEGKPNPSLSQRLESHYLGSNGNDLQLKFRRKNRFVIVQLTGMNGNSVSLQNDQGNYSGSGQIYDYQGQTSLQWLILATEPSKATATIQATVYNSSQAKYLDVAFQKGEKAVFQGSNIEIGSAKPLPKVKAHNDGPNNQVFDGQRGYGYMGDGRGQGSWWTVSVGADTVAGGQMLGISQPMDKSGKPILYVDKDGKIVTPVMYLESLPKDPNGQVPYNVNPSSKYFPARFQPSNSNVPSTQTVMTNIDPSQIAKVRFSYNPPVIVRFSDIPLDPK